MILTNLLHVSEFLSPFIDNIFFNGSVMSLC